MKNIVYFRMLYENETKHNALIRIKEYINGNNSILIQELCLGDLYLPSPFLLDELAWSLNMKDDEVKEAIYQLKITSRAFYLSLTKFEPGNYCRHLGDTHTSFGRKMICNLRELRICHTK